MATSSIKHEYGRLRERDERNKEKARHFGRERLGKVRDRNGEEAVKKDILRGGERNISGNGGR